MRKLNIVTIYNPPPIPNRGNDWVAYDDSLGADCSPCGYGPTEYDAVMALLDELYSEGMIR